MGGGVHQLFVKFSDSALHVGTIDNWPRGHGRMDALIAFWSHALAAVLFAALMLWRLAMPRTSRLSGCSQVRSP